MKLFSLGRWGLDLRTHHFSLLSSVVLPLHPSLHTPLLHPLLSLSLVKVENRESEIERLAGMLKGGRPPEALAVEGARASNERMVAHLNIQVCHFKTPLCEISAALFASILNI